MGEGGLGNLCIQSCQAGEIKKFRPYLKLINWTRLPRISLELDKIAKMQNPGYKVDFPGQNEIYCSDISLIF